MLSVLRFGIPCLFLAFGLSLTAQVGTSYSLYSEGRIQTRHDAGFTAVDGELFLLGGYGNIHIHRIDPAKGVFDRSPVLTINTHHFQAVTHNNEIYIAGAFTGHYGNDVPRDRIRIYNPRREELREGPSIPSNRRRGAAAAVVHDGYLYLIGGNRKYLEQPVAWLDRMNLSTGEWEELPDAPRARDNFAAVVIDGRIYAAGGGRARRNTSDRLFGDLEAAVDVYDISSGRWLSASERPDDLPVPRTTAATVVMDGKIVVLGGKTENQDQASERVDILDPATGRWSQGGDLIYYRRGAQGAVIGNRVYLAGGAKRGRSDRIEADEPFFEFYSLASQNVPRFPVWTIRNSAEHGRAEGQMAQYRDELYWITGFTDGLRHLNDNEKYDPATDTWTSIASIPRKPDGRFNGGTHSGIALVDDVVWLVGGRPDARRGSSTDEVWLYDIGDDSWSRGPSLPAKRGGGGLVRLGRTLHWVGGFDENVGCDVEDHYVYDLDDPAAGWQDFTDSSPMPFARNHFGTLTMGGKLYTVGGQFGHNACRKGQNQKYFHVYDPITDAWTRLDDLPHVQSHNEPSVFTYNKKIYTLGGQGAESAEVWEYDPAGDRWRTLDKFELPLRLIAPGARVIDEHLHVTVGGKVAVNFPRKEVRKIYFGPSTSKELAFHPGSLDFTTADGGELTQEAILANYNAQQTANYTIDAGDLPSWIRIDRAAGEARESHAEVEVTVNGSSLSKGTYRYTLRAEADGYQAAELDITFTVDTDNPEPPEPPEPPTNADTEFWLEAECATAVGSNWDLKSSSDASGELYAEITPGLNSTGAPPADQPTNQLSFKANLSAAGTYYLHARVEAPSGGDDSFWVRFNGGEWQRWWQGLTTSGGFAWRTVSGTPLELAAGEVTIDFAYREDGTRLDKLYLTQLAQPPTGLGASADNCGNNDDDDDGGATEPPVADAEWWGDATCATTAGSGWVNNGSYITFNGSNRFGMPSGSGAANEVLTYDLELDSDATYVLWARLNARDNGTNSLWIKVDDGDWIKFWKETSGANMLTNGFEWRRVNDDTRPVSFDLSAGSHTIRVANREAGTYLQKLYMTSTSDTPDGAGAPADNCGARAFQFMSPAARLQPAASPELSTFPNPVSGRLNVRIDNLPATAGNVTIAIVDAHGRRLREYRPGVNGSRIQTTYDVSDLASGTYRLLVKLDDGSVLRKMFVRLR